VAITLKLPHGGWIKPDCERKYRAMSSTIPFQLVAPFSPTGDQPTAITSLVAGVNAGADHQVLLGVTGSGKTFTMANVIQQTQRPALILAHNKTLAAQLFAEFREFFPNNSVQYFVSYYDYYQPEAYIPRSDTYIAKEADINQEIEKFRHASTHALLTRRDVIIVASVSCIYGLGSPDLYKAANYVISTGDKIPRTQLTRRLIDMQYERNDIDLKRGRYMVNGDTIVIFPAYDDFMIKISQFGDEIEQIKLIEPITGDTLQVVPSIELFPAKHYLTNEEDRPEILSKIQTDMEREVAALHAAGKLVEAQRLKERVSYDLEMISATGTVNGIENYSRYFDRREPGTAPSVLLDYFPSDYLVFADESHMTIPQIGGMYNGDKARKGTLIDYGFRLQAARDNRPLQFEEFRALQGQTIYISATPSAFELEKAKETERALALAGTKVNTIAEQLIRPTGIIDPTIEIRPTEGQIANLLQEIRIRIERGQRALVTTLTKRMAEDVAEYFLEQGIKVSHLHSDVEVIERSAILQDLRKGLYDCVVGINLLREGLDLPEVSLVAILDADKEGFLRSTTAMIQTIGRAARHPDGQVIMYANRITDSMRRAIDETDRRRTIQHEHNLKNGIVPQFMVKPIAKTLPTKADQEAASTATAFDRMSRAEKTEFLEELKEQMRQAALSLDYERAAQIRDQIKELQS
jgi:excinuclease ABC subunit B